MKSKSKATLQLVIAIIILLISTVTITRGTRCSDNSGLDVVFVIDTSGSIGEDNFQLVRQFTANITAKLFLNRINTAVGMILFSTNANIHFNLQAHTNLSTLLSAIENIPYDGRSTNTAAALRLLLSRAQNGALGLRNDSLRIAIIITDGQSDNRNETLLAANELHASNIFDVYAVGIAGANRVELQQIANNSEFVFFADSFNSTELQQLQETILPELCIIQAEIIDEVENETNPVTFHCRATGNPTPNISWYFNTRLLTNALDESDYNILTTTVREGVVKSLLTIRNPQLSNNGRYTCYAENIIGSDNSSRILMLNAQPYINVPMDNITRVINEGDNINFTCEVTGSPIPTVIWSRTNGDIVSMSNNTTTRSGSVFANLIITNASREDTGVYTCTANNSLGIDSINVKIISQPYINVPMDNITRVINEGDNINFTCEATGSPTPTVIWSRTNGDIVSMSNNATTRSGSVFANLIITNASREDTGVYTCTANNSLGIDSINVRIISQPYINVPMDNITRVINEGDNINFTCEATGSPTPTVIWSRTNGDIVSMSNNATTRSGSVFANLIITNASREDTGVYTCTANNSLGIDSINVRIISQPYINVPMDNTTVINEGNNINFTCEATGSPTPTVIWSRTNGDIVSMSNNATTRSGSVFANLIITNASREDTGVYTCTANNSLGIDSINVRIIFTDGCFEELDFDYRIIWPSTMANMSATNSCPNGTGIATRLCGSNNQWGTPKVANCSSSEYTALLELRILVEQAESAAVASELNQLTSQLAMVSNRTDENTSSYPADLMNAVSLIEFSLETIEDNPDILNSNETVQVNPGQTQMILNNSERFALLLSENLEIGSNQTVVSENIVIVAELVDPNNITDINFPGPNSNLKLNNSLFIPENYIEQRSMEQGIPVVNINYQNIEYILPPEPTQPISQVLSSQVTNETGTSTDTAIQLTFRYSDNINVSQLVCAFWNFSLNEGSGGWDTEGVTVVMINSNDSTITCNSTHLTSFAVLVDVSGGHQDISQKERAALSIVSYIGCGISIVCLLITLIILLYYRNTLFKGIHNFIHLNLVLALLFALITFVSGIETATESEIACTIVAALLHYFFTAVFTWMLCEGIMIYFLLVKVFSTDLGERKLLYFALGWGIPVPIVAISAGVAHDQYGQDEFCWMDTEKGAIWGFVAPMLAIIIVNIIFLLLALRSLYKSKKNKMTMKTSEIKIVKTILKATIILLPLLGITWVFGLLAVNQESSVFAWIFTVLNSLQGMFIFIFHVIRNEKLWQKISSWWQDKDKYSTMPSGLQSSPTTSSGVNIKAKSIQTAFTDLSSSNTSEMQSKSDNGSFLQSKGDDSKLKSFGAEALLVEAENAKPAITDAKVNAEVITTTLSMDVTDL